MYFVSSKTTSFPVMATAASMTHWWKLYIGSRIIRFERRAGGKGTMGRFGGGWEVKFGFQAGSWLGLLLFRSVIFNLFTCFLSFSVPSEWDNEAKARTKRTEEETAEQARQHSLAKAKGLIALSERINTPKPAAE